MLWSCNEGSNMHRKGKKLEELSIIGVKITEDFLMAKISDGREVSIPIAWFPRLVNANQDQLSIMKFHLAAMELIGQILTKISASNHFLTLRR